MILEPFNINSIGFAAQQLQTPIDMIRATADSLGVVPSRINGVVHFNADDLERIRAALMMQQQSAVMPIVNPFTNIS